MLGQVVVGLQLDLIERAVFAIGVPDGALASIAAAKYRDFARGRPLSVLASHSNAQGDPGQIQTVSGSGAGAAAEGVCAATRNGGQKAPRRALDEFR